MIYNLEFKYGTSKGRDTYGYNIVSLYINGIKNNSCNGGGYDMFGTVLGTWMTKEFSKQLKKLTSNKYYGLFHYNKISNKRINRSTVNTITYIDGACSESSVIKILNTIGYKMTRITKNVYQVKRIKK